MLIRCKIKPRHPERDGSFVVTIGNENYTFRPDENGDLVAEVHFAEHVKMFLAREDAYEDTGAGSREMVAQEPSQASQLKKRRIRDKASGKAAKAA